MSDQNPPSTPISPKIRELLSQAFPWLRFLVVLGYIGLAVGGILAIGVAIYAATGGGEASQLWVTSVTFLMVLGIFFFPLRILSRVAKGARIYKGTGDALGLELVASGVRGLAKFYGIFAIVMLALYSIIGISKFVFHFGS